MELPRVDPLLRSGAVGADITSAPTVREYKDVSQVYNWLVFNFVPNPTLYGDWVEDVVVGVAVAEVLDNHDCHTVCVVQGIFCNRY